MASNQRNLATHRIEWVAGILILATVFVLIALLKYDRWDGTLLSDYFLTENFNIIETWFVEGQGPYSLQLFRIIDLLGGLGQTNAMLFSAFGTIVGLAGVWAASSRILGSIRGGLGVLLIFALSPLTSLAASSIIGDIYLFLGFGLIGYSLFQQHRMGLKVLGAFLMFLSLEVNTCAVLLAGLFAIEFIEDRFVKKTWNFPALSMTFVIPAVFYIMFFQIFTAKGVYQSYNKIRSFDVSKLIQDLFDSTFATSFILPFACLTFIFVAARLVSTRINRNNLTYVWKPLSLIGLAYAVSAPYLLAGKSPPNYSIISGYFDGAAEFITADNSNYRHAMLPSFCAVLAFISALQVFLETNKRTIFSVLAVVLISIPVFGHFLSARSAWIAVYDREAEVGDLIKSMNTSKMDRLNACKYNLKEYPQLIQDIVRPYELHYYAGLAGGNRSTFIVGHNSSQRRYDTTLNIVCTSQDHKEKYGAENLNCKAVQAKKHELDELPSCT